MKKVTALFFTVILVLTMFLPAALAAPAYDGDVEPYAVMLLDGTSGDVLFEKNADEIVEPASTTKIMTLLLALEKGDMDSVVKVSSNAADQHGSLLHISTGEEIVMKDLINGMMLASGNDAAVAVAETIGGSEEGFAEMMNEKARELGMTSTNFVVAHGMHVDNHHTTARDMSLLTLYAMQNPDFAQIVGQETYTMPADNKHSSTWEVKNTNKLLVSADLDPDNKYYYKYATGIKTGSTPAAGDCLVSSASKDGMNLICLIFKDEYNGSERWPLTKSLFEYGFDNYKTVDVQSIIDGTDPVSANVQNAAPGSETLVLNIVNTGKPYQTLELELANKVEAGLTTEVVLNSGEALTAPVKEGETVGVINYLTGSGEMICQGKLIASQAVAAADSTAVQPSEAPATPEQTDSQTPAVPDKNGIGLIGWILIAVGAVLAVILIILVVMAIQRKRRYARRRRAVKRKRVRR